jgi:transposase
MSAKERSKRVERLPIVYANAAGLDVGAREIYVCIPPERAEENVKVFGTFTTDLNALADYLAAHQVDTVALESTGVYWIPICAAWSRFWRVRESVEPVFRLVPNLWVRHW